MSSKGRLGKRCFVAARAARGDGGITAMTYGTVTNNDTTTRFVTGNTNFISGIAGHAVTIDANGNARDAGAGATTMSFWIFNAPYYMSVNRISVFVTTASNTTNFVVGVYDVTGATLLGQATIPCGSTSSGVASAGLAGLAFTLQPGTPYILGWISDDLTCKVTSQMPSGFLGMLNANAKRMGTSTSGLSGGNLQVPIGTLTTSTMVSTPIVVLEP